MADSTRTPTASEPHADYTIQVEAPAAPAPTKASKSYVARVFREEADGQRFDEHGIRIGRWEMQPCGTDCMPNICMAWCCPCVSAAQISHRMGGSYITMLLVWGVLYLLTGVASLLVAPSSTTIYHYETYMGETRYSWSESSEDEVEASTIIWSMVSVVCWFIWLCNGMILRSSVRARYQIPSACCGDCICMWCCSCCMLSVLATHIKSYKPNTCDFGPSADALPGYDVDGPVKN